MATNGDQTKQTIRWGVCGLGHIVQVAVLPAFEHAANSELIAISSTDEEKLEVLGDKYDVKHRVHDDDFDELLRSGEIDALFIGLPNHLHREYTVRAAEAGIHVLCEKPMAVTVDECREMIEACERNDVRLMIAYRLHFDRANLEVVERVRNGELGNVRFFDSVFSQDVQPGDIRLNPISMGGGTVYDMGIYAINAARYLFRDEPLRVFASSESREGDDRFSDCDEMTHATLIFPGNRIATFTSSFGVTQVSTYRVVGTEAEIQMDPAYGYATNLAYEVHKDGEVVEAKTFEKRDQFGPELHYFANCILHDETPEPSGLEGLADVKIIEAIYESARTGEVVRIEPTEVRARPTIEQAIDRPGFEKPEEVNTSGPKE